MNVLRIGGIAVAGLVLGIASIDAQEKAAAGSQAERDLLDVSCSGYLMGLGIANPGDNATAEQKTDAEQAQDDIVSALMWVHGYTSAKQADGRFPPLTET